MDIHAKGGGIHFTVDCVCQASVDQLYSSISKHLSAMLCCGTTLVEAKSRYGLDFEKYAEKAKKEHPVSISTTYCGAHAVPK